MTKGEKLTIDDVIEIRHRIRKARGIRGIRTRIAEEFGISLKTVWDIEKRKTWKDV